MTIERGDESDAGRLPREHRVSWRGGLRRLLSWSIALLSAAMLVFLCAVLLDDV